MDNNRIKWKNRLVLLFAAAFVLRLILSVAYVGHETDIGCFIGWSDLVFEKGFSGFYLDPSFTDYPPGYMYVLYLIGLVRHIFHISSTMPATLFLIKLPASLCDLAAGYFLYSQAVRQKSGKTAFLLAASYLFNPAVFFNSAVWGQVDAVFTLCVLLTCFFIQKKKLPQAYFIFAAGILIKPQTLIFTPVVLCAYADEILSGGFQLKKFVKQSLWGLAAVAAVFAGMLPFGLGQTLSQYTDTMGSYEYASVNAYNMWTALGQNWKPQYLTFGPLTYKQWGNVFIILLVICSGILYFKAKNREARPYLTAAFIVAAMFTLSVRMHERYVFPALVLFAAAWVFQKGKGALYFYGLYSMIAFGNAVYVLFIYDPYHFSSLEPVPICIAWLSCFVFAVFIYYLCRKEIKWKLKGQERC